MHIELYDLAKDRFETTDVSARYPEVVSRLEKLMREQHTPSKDFPFPALDPLSNRAFRMRCLSRIPPQVVVEKPYDRVAQK